MVKNYAASSTEGETSFIMAEKALGMSGLELTRDQRKKISRAGGFLKEINVRKKTLDGILEESNFSRIDFISIDVEGHEIEVLKGFSLEKYLPRIVLIEDNSNQTDRTIPEYMRRRGYVIFKRTGVNDWYALLGDRDLVVPERINALEEERLKGHFENKIALHLSFLVSKVPDWTKLVPKMCIRLISNLLYKFSKRNTAPDPPKEGSH